MEKIIRVGIGSFAVKDGKILYGLRKSKHGEGKYSPPGGHLEYGETIEECAVRELYEETGLIAQEKNVIVYGTLNEIYPNNEKHYINISTFITEFTGELKNMEPDKLEKWEWLSWEEIIKLGDKNFLPVQNFIEKYPDFDPTKI
ncbi:NUDIX domain-containing protein [Candidatus Gracilibacteria bacterium]|nr:NUDIX domain-containing protein [Candidatus Gracilibacteria bacterium]